MCFEGTGTDVNHFTTKSAATGADISIEATGTDSDININLLPKGTGVINVSGTTNYEDNVLNDDDIPNKAYVDAAISSGAVQDSVKIVEWDVDLTSATTQAGSATIPAGARILRVMLDVTAASDAATEVVIRDADNDTIMAADDNDPEVALTYISTAYYETSSAGAPDAVVTTAGSTGSAKVIIEYAV
jgi:phenylpyruvate tautomerase PptA (4-oxalocrotonate tautomerase family)